MDSQSVTIRLCDSILIQCLAVSKLIYSICNYLLLHLSTIKVGATQQT